MYISIEDFRLVCDDRDIKIFAQNDESIRNRSILTAQDQISGYLCSRWDIKKEFEKVGEERNQLLVTFCCDIALYHQAVNLLHYDGEDLRRQRYEDALNWLQQCADGLITPNLDALIDDATGNNIGNRVQYGGKTLTNYDW